MADKQPTKRMRATGQGLVEAACGTYIFTLVFVLLTILGLNVYYVQTYSEKIRQVATESANVVIADKYWLGMRRPDYDSTKTQERARQVALKIANLLGLPEPADVEFQEREDANASFTTCRVKVKSLRLPYTNFVLPSGLTLEGLGVASIPISSPYAGVNLSAQFNTQSGTRRLVAQVPAFFLSENHVNNPNADTPQLNTYIPLANGAARPGAFNFSDRPYSLAELTINENGGKFNEHVNSYFTGNEGALGASSLGHSGVNGNVIP